MNLSSATSPGLRPLAGLALALGLLCPSVVWADEASPQTNAGDKSSTRAFVTAAGGLSSLGYVGLVAATIEIGNVRLTGRALLSDSIDFDVSPTEQMEEYAVLLGKSWRTQGRTVYLAGGLAQANTTTRGKYLYTEDEGFQPKVYERLKARSLGVPVEAGITWDGLITSAGLALVADFNRELTMVGVVLSLSLGKTRS